MNLYTLTTNFSVERLFVVNEIKIAVGVVGVLEACGAQGRG
jgi:hypothetical protein